MDVVIGTWNLENLCRPREDGAPPSHRCAAKNQDVYDAKLGALAEAVDRIAPDVLGVQEVGGPAELDDLAARIDGDWHTELSDHPDERGIRVGFLSRHPLTRVEDRTAFPQHLRPIQVEDFGEPIHTMGRGALAVSVEPSPGHTLHLVVCHLKSKLLTFPGNRHSTEDEGERARYAAYALFRRGAEAAAVRELADRLLADEGRTRDVVVLGDLNDEWQAATTQILYGPPGSQIGTGGFDRPDLRDGSRLWNLAPRILAAGGFSRVFEGQRELIDHILVSHALLERVTAVSTGAGSLPDVNGAQPTAPHAGPSDHAPVLARLAFP
ncbi:endonuclease/exonuclease/phosphatase family protein [Streptomyces sp. BE20]|nr:endonuclease/exonuclease/phosphatase family protein [Streptomyces sp. BE20]MEE1828560.1 endonuclease/exonuclease/phosphatase family protein [Streptomyces sp. BE20]